MGSEKKIQWSKVFDIIGYTGLAGVCIAVAFSIIYTVAYFLFKIMPPQ